MERRKFTREVKLEALKLVKERGAAVLQAPQDLGVHQTQLRRDRTNCLCTQTYSGRIAPAPMRQGICKTLKPTGQPSRNKE